MMYGNDYAYADSRIKGTIVRLNGEPVLVERVGPDYCIVQAWEEYPRGRQIRCNLDDLDVKPVPLGFINSGYVADYAYRLPMQRDWRQGLRSNNCRLESGRDLLEINKKALRNCIVGRYPTF